MTAGMLVHEHAPGVLIRNVEINLRRSDRAVAHVLLDVGKIHPLLHQHGSEGMPLRYNKDKRKNPVFSRVSAFVVAYSIPFPTLIVNEKSVE